MALVKNVQKIRCGCPKVGIELPISEIFLEGFFFFKCFW